MTTLMVYTLRKNTTEGLLNSSGRTEKEDHNVYLFVSQWEELDRIAEERDISRNELLRQILKEHLQEGGRNGV